MNTREAVFAGGCFWCTEHDLREVLGVMDVTAGYTGGTQQEANYEDVALHKSGHREAVLVSYDPTKTSFRKLCQFFLDNIDPTDGSGQFHDRGENYKTAIYYSDEDELRTAMALITELGESGLYERPITVQVLERTEFFKAEDYHQNYASKNSERYGFYHRASGREAFKSRVCAIRDSKKIEWKE